MDDHQHVWAKEPPQGEQFSKRPSVDRRGDMLDVAHNSFWTSPEELKRLRLLREEDPEFENSSDWPMVVEWCSSCAITKEVKLVLPDQEEVPKVSCELSSGMKVKRKRGGGGSRLRRLLAHQLSSTPLHPTMDSLSSNSSVWPDACRQLGDVWRLPNVGNCRSFLGCPLHIAVESCTMPDATYLCKALPVYLLV